MSVQKKQCTSCKVVKGHEEFYKDKNQLQGIRSSCIDCEKIKRKESRKLKMMRKASEMNDQPIAPKELRNMEITVNPQIQAEQSLVSHTLHGDFPIDTNYPVFNFEEKYEKGKHFSTCVFGSRNSGKSTLLKHVWPFYKTRYDILVFYCNTLRAEIYKDFLTEDDRLTAFDLYNPTVIKILDRYQKLTENSLDIGIYFDDCSDLSFTKNSDDILQLYITGRNKNMSIYYSSQSPMFINRNSRANTDYLFLLTCRTPQMKETVIEQFIYNVIPTAVGPNGMRTKGDKMTYYSDWLAVNTLDRNIIVIDYLHDDKAYKFRVNEPVK